jgi:ATP-binding cassette, subfamily B, bacterial PglK
VTDTSGSPTTRDGSFQSLVSIARVSWSLLTASEKTFFVIRVLARFALNALDVVAVGLMGVLGAMTATGISGQTLSLFGFQLPSPTATNVVALVVSVAFLFILKGGLAILFARWTSIFLAGIEVKNSAKLPRYLFTGSLDRLKKYSRSEIQFLVNSSTNATFAGVLGAMTTLIIEGTLFLSIFVMFIAVDWTAALAIAAYFGVVIFVLQLSTSRRYLQSGRNMQLGAVRAGGSVLEMVDIYREMFVLSKQNFYLSRFVEARKLSSRTGVELQILKSVPRYITESGLIIGALLFVVWQLNRGSLSEALLALGIFLAGSMRIMVSLLPLQQVWNELRVMQNWVEAAQSIFVKLRDAPELFDTGIYSTNENRALNTPDVDAGTAPDVALENVTFVHQGKIEPTIKNLSMTVTGGSTVAIVGPSGAGKTTLVDLMLGLYEPLEGTVLINGLSPQDVRAQFPGSFAYVPQKPGLVSGSIADNIALGFVSGDIDEERVWESLRKAQLASLVEQLPDGIHSSLGAHSDALSGGQIQRLGLARALYSSPRLIVLDEATSALDAATEASITEAIANLGSETTVIVIAHRLSTIQKSDAVHVMDDGQIVASGTFSEVRKKVPMIEEYVKLMSFDND